MKIIYSWDSFDRDCFTLARQLEKYKPFTLFGVPRGGLVVAVRLSHITGMKLTQHVLKDTVIVDDICQTGRSLNSITYFLAPKEDYKIVATLWVVDEQVARPDIWIRSKLEKDWVVFPWETEESSKYDKTIPDITPPEDYLTPEQLKEMGFIEKDNYMTAEQLKERGFDKIMAAEIE